MVLKKVKDLKKKLKKNKGDKGEKSVVVSLFCFRRRRRIVCSLLPSLHSYSISDGREINGTNKCKTRIQSGDALDGFLESRDELDAPLESRDEVDN